MTNDIINIYDGTTGEYIVREMTDEEQAKRDAEVAFYQAQAAEEIKAKEEAAAKRQAILDRLGLTEEEAKLLLG